MQIEKIDKVIKMLGLYCEILFNLFIGLINVVITATLLVGSAASIVLLYKLFPIIGLTFVGPMMKMAHVLGLVFNIILSMLGVFIFAFFLFHLAKEMTKSRIRVKEKKEKFIDEIVSRINKRSRK